MIDSGDSAKRKLPAVMRLSERRFSGELASALLNHAEATVAGAEAALQIIAAAVRADVGLQIVSASTGRVRSFGDDHLFNDADADAGQTRFSVVKDVPSRGILTLTAQRSDGRRVIPYQQRLLETGAAWLVAWAAAFMREHAADDRRVPGGHRAFDVEIERALRRALEGGMSASLVLIMTSEHQRLTDAAPQLAGQFRSRVRATELAGMLPPGDIAILLYDVTPPQALAVVDRVRNAIEGEVAGEFDQLAIGIAHYPAGSTVTGPVIAAARDDAQPRGDRPH